MLELYAHPFSSYSQKVLTALYEYNLDFDFRMLSPDQPANMAALAAVWPFRKFPVLIDNGTPLREATIIVEHLTLYHATGAPLIPADATAAPQLFYADWTHPIGDRFPNVTAYRQRLLARPSFARCVEEARPQRPLFPLGAPDRD